MQVNSWWTCPRSQMRTFSKKETEHFWKQQSVLDYGRILGKEKYLICNSEKAEFI